MSGNKEIKISNYNAESIKYLLELIVGDVLFVKNRGEDVTGLDEEQGIFLEKMFEYSYISVFNENGEPTPYKVKRIEWESQPLPQA